MHQSLLAVTLAATLALSPMAHACTGIQLVAKDGGVVPGRSLEFGFDLQSQVMVVPAGTDAHRHAAGRRQGHFL